jgi:hypothetical protein
VGVVTVRVAGLCTIDLPAAYRLRLASVVLSSFSSVSRRW